ncbi:hypothetical protein ACJ73_08071 [Blastomyces percursus]|uniref:Uncharacterized protein n=1 Tax=Blastomyces percursus TaxID=1658174 RepID=A0A1J9PXF8_9EURO|nr:hypothetical protein ACJ73_08071 [Blastomyces percursus]
MSRAVLIRIEIHLGQSLLIFSSVSQVLGAGHRGGPLPRHLQVPRSSIVASSVIATNHRICRVWSKFVDKGSRPSTIQSDSRKPSNREFLGQLLQSRTEATPHARQN